MEWYYIVGITLTSYWLIGVVLGTIFVKNEEILKWWAVGPMVFIGFIILYPLRAWHRYSLGRQFYEKRNITRWQYLFGKRVRY